MSPVPIKEELKRKASDDLPGLVSNKRIKKSSSEEAEDEEAKPIVTYTSFPEKVSIMMSISLPRVDHEIASSYRRTER